mmetsp:Transcript_7253/g.10929  ORF Transcript_7253/g.10929 Transcript_7253/m.10929 type:complete len:218 (-) Transcript_7253:4183-4836(-)
MPRTPSHFCHVNFILLLLFFGKCTHPSAATATLPSIHTKKLRGRADKRAAENDRRRRDAKPSISAPTPSSSSHSSLSSLRRRRRMFSVPMLFFPTGSPSLQTTTPSPALLLPSSSPSPTVWTAAPSPTTHSAPPSSSPTPSFQTKKAITISIRIGIIITHAIISNKKAITISIRIGIIITGILSNTNIVDKLAVAVANPISIDTITNTILIANIDLP